VDIEGQHVGLVLVADGFLLDGKRIGQVGPGDLGDVIERVRSERWA
jgi:hypothetical protein